jgi:SH3 domain-containing protein
MEFAGGFVSRCPGGIIMRYVVFSFLILGWVFYELSGGADFQPRSASRTAPSPGAAEVAADTGSDTAVVSKLAPEPETPGRVVETPQLVRATPVTVLAVPPAPAEVSPSRASLTFNPSPSLIGDTSVPAAPAALASLASLEQGGAQFAALPFDSVIRVPGATPAPVSTETPPNTEPAEVPDIRTIAGSRVNMRLGPGVNYAVVTSLARGAQVEVLEDPGNGWLKLRTLEGDLAGWTAASLVASR